MNGNSNRSETTYEHECYTVVIILSESRRAQHGDEEDPSLDRG